MGGGFTLLPSLLPQAQLGALNGTRPVLGRVSDCLKQLLYFPNPEKSTSHRFPGALGANLERFGSPTWPQTSSNMQQSWISSANSSSKYRQPRSAVNNTSRATSPGPADHRRTSKNRSQDGSIWRFLMASKRFREASWRRFSSKSMIFATLLGVQKSQKA